MATRGRGARVKGAEGEREAARELASLLPEYDLERGARNGVKGADDVIGLPGVHLEIKRVERIEIEKWCEQSERDSATGIHPWVIFRRNRKRWRVAMPLEDACALYADAMRWREENGRDRP